MSAYSKLFLKEGNDLQPTTEFSDEKKVDIRVTDKVNNGFDDYASDKLKDIYNEIDLDNITIPDVLVKTSTKSKSSVRLKVYTTTFAIITILLVFLSVYNIFVINTMSNSIGYLQQDITKNEYILAKEKGSYDTLVDKTNIMNDLEKNGYKEVDNIVSIKVIDKANVVNLVGETNWFNNFCNFVSSVFGG